jgi:hypothetical protein
MMEVETEARVIAANLIQKDAPEILASPAFLDLYEMAKDLLMNDRLPLQRAA